MTELLRALAALAEPPTDHTVRLAVLLGLETPTPAAYTDTFVFQQVPYASAYLNADGMIGGEARDRVAGFWRALGLTPPPEPDHLATVLGAYAGLCELGVTRARHAFLWEHLLSWLPAYLHAVRRHAAMPFPEWARLLLETLLNEVYELGPAVVLPLHLRNVPDLADPRCSDSRQIVDALLTPARSGVILSRADLARAAHMLDLSLRAGDRRVQLRSLLEQDAPAALAWIAGEARAWQAIHESFAEATGPVAGYWASRASATVALIDTLERDVREAVRAGAAS